MIRLKKLQAFWSPSRGSMKMAKLSPDGKRLAVVDCHDNLCVYDIENNPLGQAKRISAYSRYTEFSYDGNLFLDATLPYITIRNINCECVHALGQNHAEEAYFHPDGTKVIALTTSNFAHHIIKMYSIETKELEWIGWYGTRLACFAVHPNWDKLVVIDCRGNVFLEDLLSKERVKLISGRYQCLVSAEAQFANDGQKLLIRIGGKTLIIKNISSGVSKIIYATSAASFSSDGSKIAVGCSKGQLKIYDINSFELLFAGKLHTGQINHVEFSRDDTKLVTASYDTSAILWEIIYD